MKHEVGELPPGNEPAFAYMVIVSSSTSDATASDLVKLGRFKSPTDYYPWLRKVKKYAEKNDLDKYLKCDIPAAPSADVTAPITFPDHDNNYDIMALQSGCWSFDIDLTQAASLFLS